MLASAGEARGWLMSLQRLSRLKKELNMLQKEPPHGVSCWPVSEDRLDHWEAKLIGGQDTPFEGGVFKLDISIPERCVKLAVSS